MPMALPEMYRDQSKVAMIYNKWNRFIVYLQRKLIGLKILRVSPNKLALGATIGLLSALLLASPGVADIAPPHQPPGSNLEPGEELTQVRMLAETVLIEVLADVPADSLGRARVSADFTMRNLGNQDETMAARFPITFSDGWSSYPEIENIEIRVNGARVAYRRTNGPELYYGSVEVPWAEFDVAFPAGQDVFIQVSYDLEGTGYVPFIAFYYLLETGAGWKGSIGSGEIIVRLPYEANPQNVILADQIGWSQTTAGGAFSGNEIRWRFTDLEPSSQDNFEISLVMPRVWEQVLAERERVAADPEDGETWGRLGKAYKEIWMYGKGFRQDAGGIELYQLSVEAYEQAETLLPEDGLWHAGFADLLSTHAYWARFEQDTTEEAVRALGEIRLALQLAPNDPKVLEIAENISFYFPDGVRFSNGGYDFPWLTATPLRPTATSSFTTKPTETERAHTPTPEPTEANSQTGQPQLCAAALTPLILSAAFISHRKPRGG